MFEYNKDLSGLTSFHIPAKAKLFAEYSSLKELVKISRSPEFSDNEVLHIGGGSNLLFVSDFDGLVLHSAIKGISRYDKDSETAFVIAGAGEKWPTLSIGVLARGSQAWRILPGFRGGRGITRPKHRGIWS